MARQARVFSKTGFYHIMVRGLNKQPIFSQPNDYEKFLSIIKNTKEESEIQINAYCLMPNHIHFLLKEAEVGGISNFMKRILSHYAGWYNFKYERVGHLFANRYKSIPVEDDAYLVTLSKYIHQNPVKAGFAERAEDYRFSSYSDFLRNDNSFTDIDFILDVLDAKRGRAIELFEAFFAAEEDEFDFEEEIRNRDIMPRLTTIKVSGCRKPGEIRNLPRAERDTILRELMEKHGISKMVLSRLTGISRITLSNLLE